MLWKGGMSLHGGVIGVIIATYYFSIKNKINIASQIMGEELKEWI